MPSRKDENTHIQYTANDIARLRNGAVVPARARAGAGLVGARLTMRMTNRAYYADRDRTTALVVISVIALLVLLYVSLGITGAAGASYEGAGAYRFYDPLQVGYALYMHAYNAVAQLTHAFEPHSNQWLADNVPAYWVVEKRAGVLGITIVCAVLLSVSGLLYQNVFKNPLAGPSMLGATSGASLGMMLLVAVYGTVALGMIRERYIACYACGAAVMAFVILAGRKLSGRDRPFDTVTMLLVGSIASQLLGFIVSYITLFVMDDSEYLAYYTLSQMLTVDTSALSWACLAVASLASFVPIYLLRFKMNALSFEPQEARALGVDSGRLRGIALVCGGIMILAATVHTGSVGLITLIVPFMARGLFGCEFSKQLTGSICLGTILLVVCRDITDAIPFVGDGLAIGSIVAFVALPLFIVIMARHLRGWE